MGKIDRAGSLFLRAVFRRMKELGLNNSTLAQRMRVSRPYVVKVLHGDVNISLAAAARFAKALEMDFIPTLTAAGRSVVTAERATPQYSYSVIPGDRLTDGDCAELSRVFSTFYGTWSAQAPSPMKAGARIRMSAQRYRAWYGKPTFKIACCHADGRLVGQAVYLDVETSRGLVSFVVQLVVDEAHRHRGIAKSILHAAFGFSDYYAWAIVTSSPCTIAALEAATFRLGNRVRIRQDVEFLREEVFSKIDFLRDVEPEVTETTCRVNSGFFTDRSKPQPDWTQVADRYGTLPEGHEWLSVIFRDQPPDDLGSLEQMLACSGEFVREAYARMPQSRQKWAARAGEEIAEILKVVPSLKKNSAVCDFGAGSGRHVEALRRAGYANVQGIDFAPSEEGRSAGVVEADCREWRASRKLDLILCLYDVVGSFPQEEENERLIGNVVRNLKDGGVAVFSVANSAFSGKRNVTPIVREDRAAFLRAVSGLPPANSMADDGEFFAHDTLWDRKTGLFYHKEQFKDGASKLPAEYLIADRRYTLEEITRTLESSGLKILTTRFVRAGFAKPYTEQTGKEILLVCQKG